MQRWVIRVGNIKNEAICSRIAYWNQKIQDQGLTMVRAYIIELREIKGKGKESTKWIEVVDPEAIRPRQTVIRQIDEGY